MDSIETLQRRFERLYKVANDAEEQLILVDMREKEGQDVAVTRDQLETLIAETKKSMQNTLEAVEAIKEHRKKQQEA